MLELVTITEVNDSFKMDGLHILGQERKEGERILSYYEIPTPSVGGITALFPMGRLANFSMSFCQ